MADETEMPLAAGFRVGIQTFIAVSETKNSVLWEDTLSSSLLACGQAELHMAMPQEKPSGGLCQL